MDVLDPNYKFVKEFHAYLEDWEEEYVHQNTPVAHYKLLAKYANIKYVWPEDGEEEGKKFKNMLLMFQMNI